MEEVSFQDAAIILVAYNVKSNVRRQLASLLFSTQARYLSERFLYLHFAERMMPWSSGCIIDEAMRQHGELDVGVLSNPGGWKHCHKHTVCDDLTFSFHC